MANFAIRTPERTSEMDRTSDFGLQRSIPMSRAKADPGAVVQHSDATVGNTIQALIDELSLYCRPGDGDATYLRRIEGKMKSEVGWDFEGPRVAMNELIQRLNRHAPEGYYFGAAESHSPHLGFWLLCPWLSDE